MSFVHLLKKVKFKGFIDFFFLRFHAAKSKHETDATAMIITSH
jgi:hypothetical protein